VIRELALTMAITYALVATRMAAFVAVSPFPGASVPAKIRIGFALLLALAAAPVAVPGGTPGLGPPLVLAAFAEMAAGAAIGFVFRVGMSAAEVLGSSLSAAMGLTFAASYDANQGSNSDSLTRIVTMASMLVFIATGAHRVVIGSVVASFAVVPIGSALDIGVFLPGVLAWTHRSMECGVGLALPAMTVAIVVQVALGLVARAAPSLQIFSVGLSISLASGLVVVVNGLRDSLTGVAAHMAQVGAVLETVFRHAS